MPREIVPVILAGGKGLRLRPLTSEERPKPFLKIFPPLSLVQQTAQRIRIFSAPWIICGCDFSARMHKEIPGAHLICEPEPRSTAAAIALAAFALQGKDALMLVTPSDHYMGDDFIFQRSVQQAAMKVENEIVILGVPAQKPEGRYGYIYARDGKIISFFEKPGSAARAFARRKGWFWNTGIFLCKPETFLMALAEHAPAIHTAAKEAWEKRVTKGAFYYPDSKTYAGSPLISVDYAIMEKYKDLRLAPLEAGWSDIGCWTALLRVKIKTARIRNTNKEHDTGKFSEHRLPGRGTT